MYKVLYINSVCGFGSTGRIVADLTKTDDYESLVCFGRKKDFANVNSFQFAHFFDNFDAAKLGHREKAVNRQVGVK